MVESKPQFNCPYCERKSASPGGISFHVKLTHPEKREDFYSMHYDAMQELFKQQFDK